jgi:hypothetical protein
MYAGSVIEWFAPVSGFFFSAAKAAPFIALSARLKPYSDEMPRYFGLTLSK